MKQTDVDLDNTEAMNPKADKAQEHDKIYRIGRSDIRENINGWWLIEAPSEDKALGYAKRIFNQLENDERPYSFESPYEPVVMNTYNSKDEMGYGWNALTPKKVDDKPMPYEIELQKIQKKKELNAIKKLVAGRVVALDTETTGFNPDDEVLQLSVVNEAGKTVFNQYFKPEHKTSWESAMACNHITPESLQDKQPISAYKEQIETILKESKAIVGYNTGFDMTMLNQNGIDLPNEKKYIDLMMPFAKVYGEKTREGQPKRQKLIVCAAYYGFKQGGEWHNSMGDTDATMHCYRKMRNLGHLSEKDTHDLDHLVNFKSREEQMKRLEIAKSYEAHKGEPSIHVEKKQTSSLAKGR